MTANTDMPENLEYERQRIIDGNLPTPAEAASLSDSERLKRVNYHRDQAKSNPKLAEAHMKAAYIYYTRGQADMAPE
jgi:hypothetical protein